MPSLDCAGHLFAMVASVQLVKPHVIVNPHRTKTGADDVLAIRGTSTTLMVEPRERRLQAEARFSRRGRSARRVEGLVGLKPLGKYVSLQGPVEEQSGQRSQESGRHRDRRSPQ